MQALNAQEYNRFEKIKRTRDDGSSYWLARELASVLDYAEWRNFSKVVDKAMIACNNAGQEVEECFVEVNKTSKMPHGGTKSMVDYELSRYACYLIVQNGDPSVMFPDYVSYVFKQPDWQSLPKKPMNAPIGGYL